MLTALAELPYNVLWKWETDHLPGQPKNVMTKKWLPQQDILGRSIRNVAQAKVTRNVLNVMLRNYFETLDKH